MKIQRRVLTVLFGTLMLDMIGIGIIFPIIPIIFTDPSSPAFLLQGYSQGMQFFLAGAVAAIAGLMQFIAAPILGELSDAYGRKRLLTLGVATLAISQLLFGFGIEVASLALLFVARAVGGLAGANFSIAQAAIADVTEPHERAKNFGLIGAAFGLGFIIGPVLGGWVAGMTGDPASPFWLAGVLGIINVVFISLFLPETNRTPRASTFSIWKGLHNIREAFTDVDARPVYTSSFLYMSGFAFFTTFIGILLVNNFGFDEKGVGLFFGVVGFWVVLAQAVVIRFVSARYSEKQALRVSLLLLAATIAVYPFVPSASLLYVVIPFMAVAQGLSMANMTALVSKSVSESKQGAALGINGSLLALSQGVIPLAAGAASGLTGIVAPFVVGAFVVVISWVVLFKK